MKLVDKLVLKELLPMFAVGIAMFSSIYFAAGPALEASRYLAKGFTFFLVLHLVMLNIPVMLAYTFPMAMVLSVLTGFGRLSGDSEAVAIFAGGIPFWRVVASAAALGVIASLAGFYINNHLAVVAAQQITELKRDAFKEAQSDDPVELPPVMKDNHLQYTVIVGKVGHVRSGILQDVTVTFYDEHNMPSQVVYASQARWKEGVQWVLYNAHVNYLGEHAAYMSNPAIVVDFHAAPAALALLNADPSTLSFEQLKQQTRGLRAGGFDAEARKSELAMWRIIAVPLASIVFAVIGSPLGLRPQRTSKVIGWVLAVLIIFGYYVLYMVTGAASDGGTMSPMLAAFAPDIVGLVIGGVLIARAST